MIKPVTYILREVSELLYVIKFPAPWTRAQYDSYLSNKVGFLNLTIPEAEDLCSDYPDRKWNTMPGGWEMLCISSDEEIMHFHRSKEKSKELRQSRINSCLLLRTLFHNYDIKVFK
jgi:hypothetical protein